jgi:hypothetical protein
VRNTGKVTAAAIRLHSVLRQLIAFEVKGASTVLFDDNRGSFVRAVEDLARAILEYARQK